MATWGEFAAERPEMADVLLKSLAWIPIAYLATVRPDGGPRLHPFVPIIAEGRIYIAAIPSPKTNDVLRDGRYAVHALPDKRDDEFYMTGRVRLAGDDQTRALVAATAKHQIRPEDLVFELDIERVMTAYWEKVGQPGTYAVRQFWRAG